MTIANLLRFGRVRAHAWLRVPARLAKYGVVGLSGIGVITGLFWVLHTRLDLHYLLAGAVASEVAICTNYLLNNNWTFRDRRTRFMTWAGLARYHAVSVTGTAINLALLAALAGALAVEPQVANFAGVIASITWSFCFNFLWTWRTPSRLAVRHTFPINPHHHDSRPLGVIVVDAE